LQLISFIFAQARLRFPLTLRDTPHDSRRNPVGKPGNASLTRN
jgi:hypothetical protein